MLQESDKRFGETVLHRKAAGSVISNHTYIYVKVTAPSSSRSKNNKSKRMKSGDVIKERQSPRREEVVGVDGRVNKNISKTFYVSFLSSQTDHIFYLEDLLSLDVRWKVLRSFLYLPVSRQGSNLSFKLFFFKKNIFTRLLNVLKKRQSIATNVFRLQTSYEPVRFERTPTRELHWTSFISVSQPESPEHLP